MRQISADATRDAHRQGPGLATPSHRARSPSLHEVDRMNRAASNIFLKTLEEPPATPPSCSSRRVPTPSCRPSAAGSCTFVFLRRGIPLAADGWNAWITDYRAWIEKLSAGVAEKKAVADSLFGVYGLTARFGTVLEAATAEEWKRQKASLPPELEEDEQVAIETGIANGLRLRLFAEIAAATRAYAWPRLQAGDEASRRALIATIERLEHAVGLLRVNLNELAVLEHFLLSSLRLWTRR
jgi:DNA polymerase-3 subunit delta'